MVQCRSVLRVAETEFDAGWNEAGGIAEVVGDAIMHHDVAGMALRDEQIDGVSKLQLPALTGSDTAEGAKNRAVQKVAPRVYQIRRRILNRRLSTMPTTFFTRSSSVASTSKTP